MARKNTEFDIFGQSLDKASRWCHYGSLYNWIYVRRFAVTRKIDAWALREITKRWSIINTFRMSRRDRIQNLISLDKVSIRLLDDVTTDQCIIGCMSERIAYPGYVFSGSCLTRKNRNLYNIFYATNQLQESRL